MRHKVAGYKLGRNTAHRRSLLRNLVTSVIVEERVETTVPKAKAARPLVEKMITLGKRGDLAARRLAAGYLMTDEAVVKLFDTVGPRFGDRKGGTPASSAQLGTKVMARTKRSWSFSAARRFWTKSAKSVLKLAPRRLPKPRRRWKRPRHKPRRMAASN